MATGRQTGEANKSEGQSQPISRPFMQADRETDGWKAMTHNRRSGRELSWLDGGGTLEDNPRSCRCAGRLRVSYLEKGRNTMMTLNIFGIWTVGWTTQDI